MAKTKVKKVGKLHFAEQELQQFMAFADSVNRNIVAILASNLVLTSADKRDIERQIDRELENYAVGGRVWAASNITRAYVESATYAFGKLREKGIRATIAGLTVMDKNRIDLLQEKFVDSVEQGALFAKRQVSKILGEQVRRVADSVLQQNSSRGAFPAAREARSVIDRLEPRVFTTKEGIRVLTDSAGRNWTIKTYSEMLARTTLQETTVQAQVLRYMQNKLDLVEVSTTQPEDEKCKRYDGNVYSLSGDSEKYDKLDEYPPFHPNCLHNLIPYVDPNENVEAHYNALI